MSSNKKEKINIEVDIEALINLKFNIEREINTLDETFKKMNEKTREYNTSDIDTYNILSKYQKNIDNNGKVFMEKQLLLLKEIDNLLLNKCQHNWIDDVIDGVFSSRDYCYCSKCFVQKK